MTILVGVLVALVLGIGFVAYRLKRANDKYKKAVKALSPEAPK